MPVWMLRRDPDVLVLPELLRSKLCRVFDVAHIRAQRPADFIQPFGVGAFLISDHDHLIRYTGKQTSLRLALIRRFTYCIKNFEVCTPFL